MMAACLSNDVTLIEFTGTDIESPFLDLMLMSLAAQEDNAIILIEQSENARTTLST